jgi:tRNA(Ile)-lysidine synthase
MEEGSILSPSPIKVESSILSPSPIRGEGSVHSPFPLKGENSIPSASPLMEEGSILSPSPIRGEGSILSPSPLMGEGWGGGDTACFDFEELQFPLKIRSFRPGDRFRPLGVRGTQKVKAFFIDHKVPRFERERVPLLVSGERIIWVIGHRIDDGVKVTSKTRRILKVEVKQIED